MSILVVSDIHNDYKSLMSAYNLSVKHDARLVFLGDIVDYGPDPANTIMFAKYLSEHKNAVFIEGNHDNKIARYIQGNDVKIYLPAMGATMDALKNNAVKDAFLALHSNMVSYFEVGNTVMTHGGIMKEFWAGDINKKVKSAFLYGQVDNSKQVMIKGQAYAFRVYDWTKDIPEGKTVIVGHDRSPFELEPRFDRNLKKVLVSKNMQGGTVIFTDTGGGKGGFSSAVLLDANGNYQESISIKNP